jgi:hypothetical protein
VATDWPLSGQLHLRHQADHAICVRNVFGITVFRSRISYFRMRGRIPGRSPTSEWRASEWRDVASSERFVESHRAVGNPNESWPRRQRTLCGKQDGDAVRGDPQRSQQGARQMRERDDDADGRHSTVG